MARMVTVRKGKIVSRGKGKAKDKAKGRSKATRAVRVVDLDGYVRRLVAAETTDKRGVRRGCPPGFYRTRKIRGNTCAKTTTPVASAVSKAVGLVTKGRDNRTPYKVVAVKRWQKLSAATKTAAEKRAATHQARLAKSKQAAQARQLIRARAQPTTPPTTSAVQAKVRRVAKAKAAKTTNAVSSLPRTRFQQAAIAAKELREARLSRLRLASSRQGLARLGVR